MDNVIPFIKQSAPRLSAEFIAEQDRTIRDFERIRDLTAMLFRAMSILKQELNSLDLQCKDYEKSAVPLCLKPR